MSLRVSTFRRACAVSQRTYDEFRRILRTCGVAQMDTRLPPRAQQLVHCPDFIPFEPLFTPYFHFHNHQLTTLGDTLIDDYLTDVVLHYATRTQVVLTANSAKQLNAIFHNHFTMRHFARRLRFQELAIPTHACQITGTDTGTAAAADAQALHQTLDFLEPQRLPLARKDVAGTSFDIAPLPCGQSALGWKMSHFVGALDRVFGPAAVQSVLSHLYGVKDGESEDVLQRATRLLLDLVHEFAATQLAEALLAAQGLPVCFIGKTRMVDNVPAESDTQRHTSHTSDTPHTATTTHDDDADDGNTTRDSHANRDEDTHRAGDACVSAAAKDSAALLVSGFGCTSSAAAPTLDELLAQQSSSSSSSASSSSLVAGPGFVDLVQRWREGAVAQGLSPTALGAEDGWLTAAEQRRYARGPAHMHRIDVDAVHSFADAYGVRHPRDGAVVARVKHKKRVRDPLFYDKMSDMRHGVPLQTEDGEPVSAYLDRLFRRHERLFEVTMRVGSGSRPGDAASGLHNSRVTSTAAYTAGRMSHRVAPSTTQAESNDTRGESEGGGCVVGRAIARRYSVAREAACRAYIGGVLSDLQRMMTLPQGDTPRAHDGGHDD